MVQDSSEILLVLFHFYHYYYHYHDYYYYSASTEYNNPTFKNLNNPNNLDIKTNV